MLGHGGIRVVAEASGVSATTVRRGVAELESGEDSLPVGRARRAGGGRKRADRARSGADEASCSGWSNPMSAAIRCPRCGGRPSRCGTWPTSWSGRAIRCPRRPWGGCCATTGSACKERPRRWKARSTPIATPSSRYINEQVKAHQAAGEPVISVDAKKKEQLGQLPAAGREWRPKGDPVQVEDHSFFTAGPDVPLAVPYGVYDLTADAGWVNVGVDHDTSAFAVASIRRWWQARGAADYPGARRLLITADAGGSNSYRYRLWKAELAVLAAETGLDITVCHFPPGTSKWNKIEHRLFSQITMNWRGRPLTSHEVVVATIASTRTRTGLRVHAELDTGDYPLGIAVTRQQLAGLPIEAHAQHGQWNYTIAPTGGQVAPVDTHERTRARTAALHVLADERLTGMSHDELTALAQALAPAQDAQAAQRRFEQRGGQRRRAPGAGSTGLLTGADRVLITIVYLRQICSQNVLSELLGINTNTIGQAIAETRQLLDEHHRTILPTTLRFATRERAD